VIRFARAVIAVWCGMRCTSRIAATAGLLLLACDSTPTETATPREPDVRAVVTTAPAATAPAAAAPAAKPASGETWNAAQIDWLPFKAGLARAKADHKPAFLVIYTTWCPHCKNYSHVFDDPRVVEQAKGFEMIRVDSDAEPDIAAKYARDGGYIPRTYFLGSDGSVDTNVRAQSGRFQYFYDERDPGSVLGAMSMALADSKK